MAFYKKPTKPRPSAGASINARRLLDLLNGAYPCYKRFLDAWGADRHYIRGVKNNFESYADCLDVAVVPFLSDALVGEGVLGLVYLFNRARIDRDFILSDAYLDYSVKNIVQRNKDLAKKLNAKRAELDKTFREFDADVLNPIRARLVALIEGMETRNE